MNQLWFEMKDLKKRKLDKSVWIPLRSEKSIRNKVEFGEVGYIDEFIGHGTLMLPVSKKPMTKDLDWMDVGISHSHSFNYLHGEYLQSEMFENSDFQGIYLVINQSFDNNYDSNEWHLHQDLVINLGLKREKDIWVCPRQGYVEVARLERGEEGNPILIRIKNQFLKDYLCARNCGLYITSYFSRDEIFANREILSWSDDSKSTKEGKDVWECRVLEIHEGGFPFGEKIAISHASRTDVDEAEDIPDMTSLPTDSNIKSEFHKKSFKGKKLYRIMAELWKYEWINPAKISPVVLGEEQQIDIFYIVDEEGNKESGKKLKKGGKWLWFKPELASSLILKRGGFLSWYTKNTGSISCAPSFGIHFGMNDLGLITVYAKDVGNLPIWQQQIWVGYNVSPEGGISKELHDSQVKAEPASTLAPEDFIEKVINQINKASKQNLNTHFFRGHHSINEIINSINRFRAVDDKGLFSLAKDIARIIVDDIDIESLQKIATPPKKTKWGSLKTLENLLAIKIPKEEARKILSPFVGVYELRHGDAHLPSSEIENSFKLILIDRNKPSIIQGYQMIYACVENLHIILSIIEKWNKIK
ncbi:MAG: hypothetical protein GXO79_06285 [Chlorobi bacterium]|nr:hypothetical protein [Chlorobiota bacterium]